MNTVESFVGPSMLKDFIDNAFTTFDAFECVADIEKWSEDAADGFITFEVRGFRTQNNIYWLVLSEKNEEYLLTAWHSPLHAAYDPENKGGAGDEMEEIAGGPFDNETWLSILETVVSIEMVSIILPTDVN